MVTGLPMIDIVDRNVFRIGPVIKPKKLSVYSSLVGPTIELVTS